MQLFKDTVTGLVWAYEDDVIVIVTDGVYSFETANGVPLTSAPTTLQPYTVPAPTLAELKAAKYIDINLFRSSAGNASFQYAGSMFPGDASARFEIYTVQGYVERTGALPDGLPANWPAADGSSLSVATVAEWDAFYAAFVSHIVTIVSHTADLQALIAAATTPEQVAAVVW